jgi:hypothetical protein
LKIAERDELCRREGFRRLITTNEVCGLAGDPAERIILTESLTNLMPCRYAEYILRWGCILWPTLPSGHEVLSMRFSNNNRKTQNLCTSTVVCGFRTRKLWRLVNICPTSKEPIQEQIAVREFPRRSA